MLTRTMLGRGILTWGGDERQTNRYGAVALTDTNYHGDEKTVRVWRKGDLATFDGKKVRLTAVVLESRKSGHIGDRFLKIGPTQPDVGEVVELGVGYLRVERAWDGGPQVVLDPRDGRGDLWIDPRKLYRCHDQTVELYAEETDEPVTERADLKLDGAGIEDLGDGTFQAKHASVEGARLPPDIERIGDGLFSLSWSFRAGRRF